MKFRLASLVAVLFLVLSGAEATSIAGIQLPTVRDDLRLQGAGLLRKGFFFKIYVGALYTAEAVAPEEILTEVPKRIDIYYFQNIPKRYMIRAAEDTLRRNLPEERYRQFTPKIESLHDAYRDGKKGSFASLVYTPGKGLTYFFDNQPVLTIGGDDFANAYYKVWLGSEPSSRTMKEAMLGGWKEQGE
jgi:hypothetical protein